VILCGVLFFIVLFLISLSCVTGVCYVRIGSVLRFRAAFVMWLVFYVIRIWVNTNRLLSGSIRRTSVNKREGSLTWTFMCGVRLGILSLGRKENLF